MMRKGGRWIGALVMVTLLATTLSAQADGIDDFKLTRAIPADSMIAVHARDHDGKAFLNKQFERVWAAVERAHFEKDIRRLMQSMVEQEGGDLEAFELQWQQIRDLAAGVTWSRLAQRESAFAMKIGMPGGAEWVVLMVPPADEIGEDFEGLTAMLHELIRLAPEGIFTLDTEGEGDSITHRISVANSMPPMGMTLARHHDVILVGIGNALVEQSMALLRGDSDPATASLAATDRFKQAFKRLPDPADGLSFIDVSRILTELRPFAQMAIMMTTSQPVEGQSEDQQPSSPMAFLMPLLDNIDLCDYVAEVEATTGMKTVKHAVAVLRDDARGKPLYKVLYGNGPVEDPLKFVPQEATSVGVGSGINVSALYTTIIDFIKKEIDGGPAMIEQFEAKQVEIGLNIEEEIFSWIGGEYTIFTAPIPSPFMPQSVIVVKIKDQAKAAAALDRLSTTLNDMLLQQNGGVEDAKIEGAEGFKRVILPPFLAMIPGLGRPMFGIQGDYLFLGNGPEALTAALETAAGTRPGFAESDLYKEKALAIEANSTSFAFSDLNKWGDEMGQGLSAMTAMIQMFQPQLASDPTARMVLGMLGKAGRVLREFNFYDSKCTLTTFDGEVSYTKTVTHYKEPPVKKRRAKAKPASEPEPEPKSESENETAAPAE